MQAIVVLGHALDKYGAMSEDLRARVEQAVWLHDRNPESALIMSGNRSPRALRSGKDTRPTQASVMADYAEELGVFPSQIIEEDASTTTWENAKLVKPLIDTCGWKHFCVVTSDYHLERTMMVFGDVFSPLEYKTEFCGCQTQNRAHHLAQRVRELLATGYYKLRAA